MLLRLIDDYLFITTDHAKAKKFLDVMVEGQESGICIYCIWRCPRTSRIWLLHLPGEIHDKFQMRPTHCDGNRTRTEMCVPKALEYLIIIWRKIAFPWCALFINMDDLSVSTDYTRYHDKCKSYPYVVECAFNWRVDQSLWILLPLTADVVPVLPSYTRCCSAFHNTQFYRDLCLS